MRIMNQILWNDKGYLKSVFAFFISFSHHTRKSSDPLIKSEPVITKDAANDDDGEEADGEEKQKKDDKGKPLFHIKRGFIY